jgi:hypothetical protein
MAAPDPLSDQQRLQKGDADAIKDTPPAPGYVTWLHSLAPYRGVNDLHHHIGKESFDAAAGSHRHRSGEQGSVPLFDGDAIVGDLSTTAGLQTAVRAIARAMQILGMTNSTTN